MANHQSSIFQRLGAKGPARWNDRDERYEIVHCNQQAILLTATLDDDLCPDQSTAQLSDGSHAVMTFPPYGQEPDPLPNTAKNYFDLAGKSGDICLLVWDESLADWAIVQIRHHKREFLTDTQYQSDIPPVEPIVTKFNVQVGFCPCCGRRVQGQHPEPTSQALGNAAHTLGPRAIATAADCKYHLGLPFRRISKLFGNCFNLQVCPGGLSRATSRLARAGAGVFEALKLQLPGRPVVHADETSWWIGGEKAWLHTFATDDLVIFSVGGRGHDVALDVLGADFRGRVCCDGYAGDDVFDTARCNAHPLRRLRDLLETNLSDRERRALEEIQQLLQGGLLLRDRREELTPLGFRRLVTGLKGQVHDWIESHAVDEADSVGRLARHLGRYEQEFLLYLDDPLIPATNNYAEGTLRFAVLLRKVGCCNRSVRGVRTFEILSSLLATFQRRGRISSRGRWSYCKGVRQNTCRRTCSRPAFR